MKLFRTSPCTIWDTYLILFGGIALLGFIAYHLQLPIIAILLLAFIVSTLAGGFGR